MNPKVSFGDDPLRMLRLFRFMSTHSGSLRNEEALRSVEGMKERLQIVSG